MVKTIKVPAPWLIFCNEHDAVLLSFILKDNYCFYSNKVGHKLLNAPY